MIRQSCTDFEGSCDDVAVILIVGLADEVAAIDGGRPVLAQINFNKRIDDKQTGITAVTLYVQIMQVLRTVGITCEVLGLVAFPRKQVKETDVGNEASEVLQLEMSL